MFSLLVNMKAWSSSFSVNGTTVAPRVVSRSQSKQWLFDVENRRFFKQTFFHIDEACHAFIGKCSPKELGSTATKQPKLPIG